MLTTKGGLKPGVQVVIGGEEYTAPQLNFGALRRMAVELDRNSPTYHHDVMAYVLLNSLGRNYDGVNAVWLNDTLEGSEIDGAAKAELAILKASGLKIGEQSLGEAPAAA